VGEDLSSVGKPSNLYLIFLVEKAVVASNKILVIDDTTVVRVKVREMLPPGNFEVLEAKDGLEGYNLILREKVSLIMLDFLLPKMSGWEVFQKVQAQADLRKIPLVIMSGRKEEVTEKILEPFKYFEFLGKPFDQKQLVGAIKSAMAKAKLPREDVAAQPAPVQTPVAVQTTVQASVAVQTTKEEISAGELVNQASLVAEIKLLQEKTTKMQTEIESLKKQLTQVVTFVKQKIK